MFWKEVVFSFRCLIFWNSWRECFPQINPIFWNRLELNAFQKIRAFHFRTGMLLFWILYISHILYILHPMCSSCYFQSVPGRVQGPNFLLFYYVLQLVFFYFIYQDCDVPILSIAFHFLRWISLWIWSIVMYVFQYTTVPKMYLYLQLTCHQYLSLFLMQKLQSLIVGHFSPQPIWLLASSYRVPNALLVSSPSRQMFSFWFLQIIPLY